MGTSQPKLYRLIFLITEGAIYFGFLFLDLSGRSSQTLWPKYAGILFCLFFALHTGKLLIAGAMALTAWADWFLLLGSRHLWAGIILFLGVQLLYLLHLKQTGVGITPLLRIFSAVTLLTVAIILNMATALNLLALLYFSQLLSNTVLAWQYPRLRCFAWGLTLFICCDLCVGLFHLFPHLPFVPVGMWLFYLPSQVLIVISAYPAKEAHHEIK